MIKMTCYSRFFRLSASTALFSSSLLFGQQDGYEVFGKKTSLEAIKKQDQGAFYELEKKTYERVEAIAQQAYLEAYFNNKAKEKNMPLEAFKDSFFASEVKVSDADVAKTLEVYKNEPELSKRPLEEQKKMIRQHLMQKAKSEVIMRLLDEGEKAKNLLVHYPKPKEPVFSVKVGPTDVPRYAYDGQDNQSFGCEGDKCPVTIVEFSEYQCPFCARVMPQVKQVLDEYKGKVRWVVKDYPLPFHDRAKPAAIAAKCAGFQGKYWKMYTQLFSHQADLTDAKLSQHAKDIGLDMKQYDECVKSPAKALDLIDKNFQQGVEVGVTGTPAFFINGRRFSGAISYSEFKRAIEEELKKKS